MTRNFTSIFWQEDDQFVGLCLDIDISSFGDTEEEARRNLSEAISLTLEDEDFDVISLPQIKLPKIESLSLSIA